MKLTISQPAQHDHSIQALRQGMQMFNALIELRTPLSLEQICDHMCLPKSAAFQVIVKLLKGTGPAVCKRKADCLQISSTTATSPGKKRLLLCVPVIYPIFAQGRLRRLHPLQFEDAVWDVAASRCL